MKDPQSMGMNRTGIAMSPLEIRKMLAPTATPPPPTGGLETMAAFRARFIAEADPVGKIPLPATVKGAAKTVIQKIKGDRPEVLLDKLGERAAFERSGVRLYDLVLNKARTRAADLPGLRIERLEQIRMQELEHFTLVARTIQELGADPTAVTPGADVNGVMAMGLVQALSAPSVTVQESLEGLLTAELTDNDAWTMLVQLTEASGLDQVAAAFRRAEAEEREHLATIRELVRTLH